MQLRKQSVKKTYIKLNMQSRFSEEFEQKVVLHVFVLIVPMPCTLTN